MEPDQTAADASETELSTAMLAEPDATNPTPSGKRQLRVLADLGHPFAWGFLAAAGLLVATSLGGALSALSTVAVSIGVALFIALALEPLVRWLGKHGMSRGMSIAVVFVGFAVFLGGGLAIVIPMVAVQITQFAQAIPGYITNLQNAEWFQNLLAASGSSDLYENLLNQARTWLSNPANLLTIGGGALAAGTGLINMISGTMIAIVLALYFLASINTIKSAFTSLAPAYARPRLGKMTDHVTESVGQYVSGMAILALCNSIFAFILLSILGVPFAFLMAFLALLITMIPMIGSVLFWLLASLVALLHAPLTGLIFLVVYFAYMQVEAYVMTPRVMNKAVDIPGSLVLIGAMVGGTLLGLLGALIAVPVTATLLMILKEVFIPRQDAKVVPD